MCAAVALAPRSIAAPRVQARAWLLWCVLPIAVFQSVVLSGTARAITIDWVTVGYMGNLADTTGYGSVSYGYNIMKFEFTNAQYVQFLNSVDPNGAGGTVSAIDVNLSSIAMGGIYRTTMNSSPAGGISFTSANPNGAKYAVKTNFDDKPATFISWFAAAQVANWLHNGAQTYATSASGSAAIVTGAYEITSFTGAAPAKNSGALYWVPTEDEWYKAAYFSPLKTGSLGPNGSNGAYYTYSTQSDTQPTAVAATIVGTGSNADGSPVTIGNFANFGTTADWNGRAGNATSVGTNGGPGFFGTFDMSGNIDEWSSTIDITTTGTGVIRGGGQNSNTTLPKTGRTLRAADFANATQQSFRLAAVPEPSTWAMGGGGLAACAAWNALRRRSRRNRRDPGALAEELLACGA